MAYWSVAQTESQRENVAAGFLRTEGFEVYLPRIEVKTTGRARVVPLFPGYVFVAIVDRWWSVRWTPGVLRLLMVDEAPARIDGKVMSAIRRREDGAGLVQLPKPRGLTRGDRVRITRGSFEQKVGVWEGMSGGDRSRVLIELLGRSVPVSIANGDLVVVDRG